MSVKDRSLRDSIDKFSRK